jgi:uncharacterized protein HemY
MKKVIVFILIIVLMSVLISGVALADYNDIQYNNTNEALDEKINMAITLSVISVIIAFAVPGIFAAVWTKQLKSVKKQDFACNYMRQGSMNVTMMKDIFLYRNVSRVPRAQNTSKRR